MKISPIYISPLKTNNLNIKPKKSESINKTTNKAISVPFGNYYIPFLGNSKYRYTPVSLTKPNYNLLNCNYSNLDEFSDLFANKINSQLTNVNLSDIKALQKRIELKTNADEKLINNVLYQLTLFSNYNAIDFFQEIANKYNTNVFGVNMEWLSDKPDVSSSKAIDYFSRNKKFITSNNTSPNNSIIILDNILIKQLKSSKKSGSNFYKQFIKGLKNNASVILNMKGWDVKCSDGLYRSSAFLYGNGDLENLAVDTIKRIQNGEDIDDVLYSDNKKQLLDLIKDDVEERQIEILDCDISSKQNEHTSYDILANLKNKEISADSVKSSLQSMLYKYSKTDMEEKIKTPIFSKYLDEMSCVNSFDTINQDLIAIYDNITEQNGDNVYYLIMEKRKSADLINHLYAHANHVSPDRFVFFNDNDEYFKNRIKDKVPAYVLDDISASGKTVEKYLRNTKQLRNFQNSPINFCVINASDSAMKLYNEYPYKPGRLFYIRHINDIENYTGKMLNDNELETIKKTLYSGFWNTALSVAFPYIIPDNCSNLPAEIFDKLLIKSTPNSNKALTYFNKYA